MAGTPWDFTVLPNTITEVTITNGSTTVTVQKEASGKFFTGAFVETATVTISATGYASKTATVGDAVVDFSSYVSNITKDGVTYQLKDANATTLLTTKADTNLSNLTATGKARFTTKANTDLSNVNNTGKSTAAGWAMPSGTHVNLTLGASGTTYTAPANGYFCIKASNEGATGNYQSSYSTSYGGRGQITSYGYSSNGGDIVPMTKGQTMTFVYETNVTNCSITFVYAEGSKSEA